MNRSPLGRPRFTIHGRLKSFTFAFAGLRHLFASEHNVWLHAVAAAAAVGAGIALRLPATEWPWIVLAIGWVFSAEAFNTAIERLAGAVTQERDPRIGLAKDVAAAGVLISAIGAASIGALIFTPYMLAF